MIYGFDTDDEAATAAALLVYCVYRSRDQQRYKVSPDMWSQIERFAKASAKRATSIPRFLESFKPRLLCGTIAPKWMAVGVRGVIPMIETPDGLRIQVTADDEPREFLTAVIARADERTVLDRLYHETAWVILLVRDRLDRERPVEHRVAAAFAAEQWEAT